MGRIRLEILPWVSDFFSGQGSGRIILEKNIENGATIGSLVKKLASEHQAFGEAIFDTKADKLSGYVMIVINDRMVEALDGLDTHIKDGDIIRFLPVIAGG